jgi:hypothetical protein
MVLIHCGGNDIGIDPCGKLLFHLKFAVYVISKMLPASMIAYYNLDISEIETRPLELY